MLNGVIRDIEAKSPQNVGDIVEQSHGEGNSDICLAVWRFTSGQCGGAGRSTRTGKVGCVDLKRVRQAGVVFKSHFTG